MQGMADDVQGGTGVFGQHGGDRFEPPAVVRYQRASGQEVRSLPFYSGTRNLIRLAPESGRFMLTCCFF